MDRPEASDFAWTRDLSSGPVCRVGLEPPQRWLRGAAALGARLLSASQGTQTTQGLIPDILREAETSQMWLKDAGKEASLNLTTTSRSARRGVQNQMSKLKKKEMENEGRRKGLASCISK